MIPKRLTPADVTFEIRTEPEDIEVRGNFMCGDPEYEQADRELEDRIIERLNSGDYEAWCLVIVEARHGEHLGSDSLGGCSLSGDYTADTVVDEHGMRENALDALQKEVDRAALKDAERAVLDALAKVPEDKLARLSTSNPVVVSRVVWLEQERREIASLVEGAKR